MTPTENPARPTRARRSIRRNNGARRRDHAAFGRTAAGLALHQPIVNEMVTSLDMAGCSLSLLWLDDELQALFDAPCASAAYVHA